jgi:hypothetical protein
VKFFIPLAFNAPMPFHVEKESTMVPISGTKTKNRHQQNEGEQEKIARPPLGCVDTSH